MPEEGVDGESQEKTDEAAGETGEEGISPDCEAVDREFVEDDGG